MWKVDQILQIFAPFDCLSCQVEGALLCRDCQLHALPAPPGCCYKCFKATAGALCMHCRAGIGLQQVWVVSTYKDVTSQLISRLKFSRTQAAAHIMAQTMAREVPALPSNTIIVHVPTASQRIRQRGYDQAQLLAREFARSRGLKYQPLLRRQGKTRQLGATRQERLSQLKNAYYCSTPGYVRGQRILLIDDVLTTGATIEAATSTLLLAGAKDVKAALFAQKI